MNNPLIALVDSEDKIIGYSNKTDIHKKGLLHRAFSVFIFNEKGDMLIHQRAKNKYHSPSLWTNACCSHLLENKTINECLHDRLQFEMGFDVDVNYKFKFTYSKNFDNGLIEHETDYVYVGLWNGTPELNSDEVDAYKWISINDLKKDMEEYSENYTYWFTHIMKNFEHLIISN